MAAIRRYRTALVTAIVALVAMGISSTLGNPHGHAIHQKVFAFAGAFAFVVLAVVSVRQIADNLAASVDVGTGRSGGLAIKWIVSFVGYIVIIFVALGLLAVPVEHLLVGGAVTGVIVGIAAQQALGNVFAGVVLMLARPFYVGERVRIRAGSLGGIFEGVVRTMSLTYTTIETDDGAVNVPNSVMLAIGVGPAPKTSPAVDLAAVPDAPSGGAEAPEQERSKRLLHPLARILRDARDSRRSN